MSAPKAKHKIAPIIVGIIVQNKRYNKRMDLTFYINYM